MMSVRALALANIAVAAGMMMVVDGDDIIGRRVSDPKRGSTSRPRERRRPTAGDAERLAEAEAKRARKAARRAAIASR